MKRLAAVVIIFAFAVMLFPPVHASSQATTGLIVPLYSYPGAEWTQLIQQAQANPTVPIVAVVNVDYGPGWPEDYYFASQVQLLQAAGITVVGYVWTGYGTEGMDWIQTLTKEWVSWYGVSGVFLDAMSNVAGDESYYSTETAYAHSLGANLVIGNAGAWVPSSYIGTVDNIVISENAALPSLSYLQSFQPRTDFSMLAYSVGLNQTFVQQAAKDVSLLYLTDAGMPSPYFTLPSYIGSLLSALAAPPSPNPNPTTSTYTVSITTNSYSSGELFGMYTMLWQNGTMLQSCWSPCSFSLTPGHPYQIAVADWSVWGFEHWQDWSSNRFFTISAPTDLTAQYS